jgi:uncharacterized protein (DUF924 family)
MDEAHDVLQFWFGTLDEKGCADDATIKRWWTKSAAFDAEIRNQFEGLRESIVAGSHEHWLNEPLSLVAYIVVVDQFCRNVGRGTPVMYEGDERALAATHRAIEAGWITDLGVDHAIAVLMPLMHSEAVADQKLGIAQFEDLARRNPEIDRLPQSVDYMVKHHDIVAQFGRFPHRNEILGRESTPEELAFLQQPGSSF